MGPVVLYHSLASKTPHKRLHNWRMNWKELETQPILEHWQEKDAVSGSRGDFYTDTTTIGNFYCRAVYSQGSACPLPNRKACMMFTGRIVRGVVLTDWTGRSKMPQAPCCFPGMRRRSVEVVMWGLSVHQATNRPFTHATERERGTATDILGHQRVQQMLIELAAWPRGKNAANTGSWREATG